MQYRRNQHLVVRDTEPGENRRDRDRMGDIRVTAVPFLTLMALRRDILGTSDQVDVGVRLDSQEGRAEFRDGLACGRAVHTQDCKEGSGCGPG
jgi:hypothetical protein